MKMGNKRVVICPCTTCIFSLIPTMLCYRETDRFEDCKPYMIDFTWLWLSFLICIKA